jgi:hypothetical protein
MNVRDPNERVIVVMQPQAAPSRSHPFLWLGAATAGLLGLLYYLRGRAGWQGGLFEGKGTGTPEMPATPVLPYDEVRLSFTLIAPTDDHTKPMQFRGPNGATYSLDELVDRVKAGGRSDLTFKASGSVLQSAFAAAEAGIKAAGLTIYAADPTPVATTPVKVGRGYYR